MKIESRSKTRLCSDGKRRAVGISAKLTREEIEHLFKKRIAIVESGCWEWLGTKTSTRKGKNYGEVKFNGVKHKTHRFAYEIWRGKIPKGILVCHHCDNPPCVNPDHLFLGTSQDNLRDCVEKGRHRNGQMVHPEIIKRGEDHWNAKLTWDDVRKIRSMRPYETYRSIAQMFNVSTGSIKRIVTGKAWNTPDRTSP